MLRISNADQLQSFSVDSERALWGLVLFQIFELECTLCVCVCVCVIVKRPVLPPCAVDGRSRNPLYYYYYYYMHPSIGLRTTTLGSPGSDELGWKR